MSDGMMNVDEALRYAETCESPFRYADLCAIALGSEVAALRAENAALRADKERLDWLDLRISTQETADILGQPYSACHTIRGAIAAARAALAKEAP